MEYGRRGVVALAVCICVLILVPGGTRALAIPPHASPCGTPIAAGTLVEPPQIEISTLALDDLGRHELIMQVVRSGDRFCYRYEFAGQLQHVSPILRVHRGERFSLRMVNGLAGPAPGLTMSASALPRCLPKAMAPMPPRPFVGYLDHTIYARQMPMPDIDVNLHLHGFEGPPQQENVFLSTLSTPAHACEYDITIPRSQPPGTYYYHPHAHAVSDDEVAGGLSGMWIVDPDAPAIPVSDQHAVIMQYRVPFVNDYNFLRDVTPLEGAASAHEAALSPSPVIRYDPFNPPPWPSALPIRAAGISIVGNCGSRSGSLLTVDGVDAPARLTVPAGKAQLFRLLNATSDSVEYLRIRDANGKLRMLHAVGRDGIPVGGDFAHPLARYIPLPETDLVPTGRTDVLLTLRQNEVVTLYAARHCTAPADELHLRRDLLIITAGTPAPPAASVTSLPLRQKDSTALALIRFARAHPSLVHRRAITYTEYAIPNATGHGVHAEYYITQTSLRDFHESPYWPVYDKNALTPRPQIVVKRGSIEEWYLFNATLEVHTFHIHQMAFVAEDAQPQPMMVDTVVVPFGRMLPNKRDPDYPLIQPSVTHVLLDFRRAPRGTFLFHCHMLFHEDRGMMAVIRVE